MTPTNDGGPAYPTLPEHSGYSRDSSGPGYPMSTGMSLRDWFAGMAMQQFTVAMIDGDIDDFHPQDVAHESYALADAMLAEREKVKP